MAVRRLPLLLLLLLGLGCGSAEDPGPPGSGAAPAGSSGLPVGRAFDAVGASEGGRERPLVAKAGIEFMADGRAFVSTGCNSGSAKAQLRDGRLVSDGFATTQMGCMDPGVSEQETFVMSVVGGEPTVVLDGNTLILRTAGAEIRFLDRKVADPDRRLEGTRWRVNGLFDKEVASSIAAPQGELVLSGGRVRFTGPCHDHEGPAEVAGTTVTFGTLERGAARPCDPGQQRSEADVLRVLDGPVQATVRAGSLRLEHPGGYGVTLVEAR